MTKSGPLPKEPPPTELVGRDRRRGARTTPARLVRCRVRTGRGEALGATVLDLSPLGVGLLLRGEVHAGDAVVLEFPREGRGGPETLAALVTYCGAMDGGRAVVGCEFNSPLGEVQVARLLR